MRLARLMLIVAAVLFSYSYAVACMIEPRALLVLGIAAVALIARKGYQLSSHGTAKWATADDLKNAGMLDAQTGLILGRIAFQPPKLAAINGLFYPSVGSADACRDF